MVTNTNAGTKPASKQSSDGGDVSRQGSVLYRIWATPNADGSMTVESVKTPRALLGFLNMIGKIQNKLSLAKDGNLLDIAGDKIAPENVNIKLATIPLGANTKLRIGSVMGLDNGQLSILLVKESVDNKHADLPILLDPDAEPSFALRDSGIIAWLKQNATLKAEVVETTADSNVQV